MPSEKEKIGKRGKSLTFTIEVGEFVGKHGGEDRVAAIQLGSAQSSQTKSEITAVDGCHGNFVTTIMTLLQVLKLCDIHDKVHINMILICIWTPKPPLLITVDTFHGNLSKANHSTEHNTSPES